MCDAEAQQPVAQAEQVSGHRLKLGTQLRAHAPLIGHVHASGDLCFVNVERGAALMDVPSLTSLEIDSDSRRPRGTLALKDSAWRAHGNRSGFPRAPELLS